MLRQKLYSQSHLSGSATSKCKLIQVNKATLQSLCKECDFFYGGAAFSGFIQALRSQHIAFQMPVNCLMKSDQQWTAFQRDGEGCQLCK